MTWYGIVGNRKGWTYLEFKNRIRKHNITYRDIIVSGGAEGVDTYAQQFAKEIGCLMVIFYPNPKISTPQRYFNRNDSIVLQCDELIAFDKKKFSGTLHTVNGAKILHKKVTFYRK